MLSLVLAQELLLVLILIALHILVCVLILIHTLIVVVDYGDGRSNAAYGNFLIASVMAHCGEVPLACHARGTQERRMCIACHPAIRTMWAWIAASCKLEC